MESPGAHWEACSSFNYSHKRKPSMFEANLFDFNLFQILFWVQGKNLQVFLLVIVFYLRNKFMGCKCREWDVSKEKYFTLQMRESLQVTPRIMLLLWMKGIKEQILFYNLKKWVVYLGFVFPSLQIPRCTVRTLHTPAHLPSDSLIFFVHLPDLSGYPLSPLEITCRINKICIQYVLLGFFSQFLDTFHNCCD